VRGQERTSKNGATRDTLIRLSSLGQRPHIHPIGAEVFLTYRLASPVLREAVRFYKAKADWLRNEIRQRLAMELLDSGTNG